MQRMRCPALMCHRAGLAALHDHPLLCTDVRMMVDHPGALSIRGYLCCLCGQVRDGCKLQHLHGAMPEG